MSLPVNQAHINKASALTTAVVTGYDGIGRINDAFINQKQKNQFGGKWGQATIGVIEIAAAFFAGRAALK